MSWTLLFKDYPLKPARDGLGIPSLLWLSRVLDAHEEQDEREKAFAALRQEIPDFDARVEKERARASVKLEPADTHGGKRDGAGRPSVADMVQAVESAKVHGVVNQDSNSTLNHDDQPKRQKRDSAYWIARLKRDAATDTHAASL